MLQTTHFFSGCVNIYTRAGQFKKKKGKLTSSTESTRQLISTNNTRAVSVVGLVHSLNKNKEESVKETYQSRAKTWSSCFLYVSFLEMTATGHRNLNCLAQKQAWPVLEQPAVLACHFFMLFQRCLNSWKPSFPVLSLWRSIKDNTLQLKQILGDLDWPKAGFTVSPPGYIRQLWTLFVQVEYFPERIHPWLLPCSCRTQCWNHPSSGHRLKDQSSCICLLKIHKIL